MKKPIDCLFAMTDVGQKKPGVELVRDFLLENHDFKKLSRHFSRQEQIFSAVFDPNRSLFERIKIWFEYSQKVCEHFNLKDHFRLVIGGDHSVALGSVMASLQKVPDTHVIWVDAHADINTLSTSPSGNPHGMPLSVLTGLMNQDIEDLKLPWFKETLDFKRLAYIGLRDVDAGEQKILDDNDIFYINAKEINENNLSANDCLDRIFDYWKYRPPIHLSFDIDGVDPLYFPSTGTPVNGGISLNFAIELIQGIKADLIATDLVELNPQIGSIKDQQMSLDSFNQVLKAIIQ